MTRRARSKYAKPNAIIGQFSPYPVDMLASPAWRALSLSARRCLERIAIELAKHGGRDNSELPVTYRDFVAHGVPRARIKPSLAELVALGFIEMTPGHASLSPDYGRAARFCVLFLNCIGPLPDHTRWRRFKTHDEAKLAGKLARASAMPKKRTKAPSHASPHGSQSEPLASSSQSEPLGKVRKVNHYPLRKVNHCLESRPQGQAERSPTAAQRLQPLAAPSEPSLSEAACQPRPSSLPAMTPSLTAGPQPRHEPCRSTCPV
jgi:hypothetical protein